MKKILIDILLGLLVIVLVLAAEFLVTLPFTEIADTENPERWQQLINRELLLASVPAFLITFLLAWARRTPDVKGGLLRGVIWGAALVVFYVFIGVNNQNLGLLFGSLGLYTLVLCAIAGPVVRGAYAAKKKPA